MPPGQSWLMWQEKIKVGPLLKLLPPRPNPKRLARNGWMDGWLSKVLQHRCTTYSFVVQEIRNGYIGLISVWADTRCGLISISIEHEKVVLSHS